MIDFFELFSRMNLSPAEILSAKDALWKIQDSHIEGMMNSKETGKEVSEGERNIFSSFGRIAAIKAYRQRTGCFLKEAKEAIDLAFPPIS